MNPVKNDQRRGEVAFGYARSKRAQAKKIYDCPSEGTTGRLQKGTTGRLRIAGTVS